MRRLLVVALSGLLIGSLTSVAPAAPPNALEAGVRPFSTGGTRQSYPAQDASGVALPSEAWSVVPKTGNCCENYLAATSKGQILDFGGGTIRVSDDGGQSWKEVFSLATLGAEGAVVEAPGGDIVGVTWDPYSGDRLEAFKFEAASGKWYYAPNSLHQPFFDRPYIAVVPGPFQVGGMTVPYLTYMLGGWPQKTTYVSTDGLNYVPTTSPSDAIGSTKSEYLPVKTDTLANWTQPLTVPAIAPLAGGGGLAWEPAGGGKIALNIIQPPSTTWTPFSFPDKVLTGRLLSDSRGRLHNVSVTNRAVDYQVTPDGGKTWWSTSAQLPDGYEAIAPAFDRFWDFKANSDLEMGVVSLYARNTATGKDQNLVMVFSTRGDAPRVEKTLWAGKGDKAYGTGLGASDRLDFITLAILPDGRIVTTFLDTQSSAPVVAITSSTQAPTGQAPSTPVSPPASIPSSPPSEGPDPQPSASPGGGEADTTSPRITNVSDSPDPITPNGDGRRDVARLRFTLSEAASVDLRILTRRGRLVRTIRDAALLGAGTHRARWFGRNDAGKRVRPRTYFYEIIALDASGNQASPGVGKITVV